MISKKIQYILVLFIILSLSMNVFSATNFTNDSGDDALQSSPVDEVVADTADESTDDSTDDQTDDSKNSEKTTTGTQSTKTGGNGTQMPSFGNGTGTGTGSFGNMSFGNMSFGNMSFGNMSFGNGTGMNFNFSGMNFSNMSMDDFMDIIKKFMGGDDNTTNATDVAVASEASDVPRVVTSSSYAPVSNAPSEKSTQHIIQRLRDNTTVSTGDALRLEGVNRLYDSDFTNGHLLIYVDGKLVFNEITAGDLSTPIFWIDENYLGQHQITAEFTANGNPNTNKYTEDVLII